MRALTKTETTALLDVTATRPRDNELIRFLLATGCRASEVAALRVADVIGPDGQPREWIQLRTFKRQGADKPPSRSKVCCPSSLRARLAPWCAERPQDAPLFPGKLRRGTTPHMTRRGVWGVVNRALSEAGIEGASTHATRHTYATGLVRAGVSLASVRDLCRHENIATTSTYLHSTDAEMAQAVEGVL